MQSVLLNISGRGNAELGTIFGNCSGSDCSGSATEGNFSLETISETTSVSSLTMHFNSTDVTNSLGDGNYTFHFHANDSNGSRERLTVNATTFIINNNPPLVSVFGGAYLDASNVPLTAVNVSGNFTITVNLTERGTDFDTVRFNITNLSSTALEQVALLTASNSSDANNGSVNTTFNATYDTASLLDGDYEIVFYLNDTQTNNLNSTESRNITIDNTAPNLTNLSVVSSDGVFVEARATVIGTFSNIDLNATATDVTTEVGTMYFNFTNATGEQIQFIEGDQLFNAPTTITQWNATINSSSLRDGKYQVYPHANDTAGTENTTERWALNINNLAPDVQSFNTPSITLQNVSANFTVNFTASELGVYVDTVFLNITNESDGIQVALVQGTLNGTDLEWNSTLDTGTLDDGNYTITVYMNDTENLLNNTVNETIHVDNTQPRIHNLTVISDVATAAANGSAGTNFSINLSLTELNYDTIIASIQHPDGNETQNVTLTRPTGDNDRQFNGILDSANLVNGVYNIDIFANDTAGNTIARDNLGAVLVETGTNTRGTLINNTVVYAANVTQSVDATTAGNITVGILMHESSSGTITVVGQKTNPTLIALPGNSLGRFASVDIDSNSTTDLENATITMTYSDDDVPSSANEADIVLYHLADGATAWESLPPNSFLNTGSNSISGVTTSFSTFALGVPNAPATVAAVSTAGSGGGGSGNVISGLTKDVGILPLEGKDVIMSENSAITFKYQNGAQHKINIEEIDQVEGYVTGTLESTSQEFRINLDETKEFDLNDNNANDLRLSLTRIYRGRAYLTLQEMTEVIQPTTAPTVEEAEETEEKGKVTAATEKVQEALGTNKTIIAVVLSVLLLIFGCLALYYYKKHKK